MNILSKIIEDKIIEVEADKKIISLEEIKQKAFSVKFPTKKFIKKLHDKKFLGKPSLIAEIKKQSPSKGIIRGNFNPSEIAKAYQKGGADCMSVLTDKKYFAGKKEYIAEAQKNSSLPIIRKDFIIDEYQVFEARVIGADCILLIMANLELKQAQHLCEVANYLQLDVLVETHDEEEIENALKLNTNLIGINNRNLKTFEISLETGERLVKLIPQHYIKVCESGIYNFAEITEMQKAGFDSFLVGESLMRQNDIEAATKKLLGM